MSETATIREALEAAVPPSDDDTFAVAETASQSVSQEIAPPAPVEAVQQSADAPVAKEPPRRGRPRKDAAQPAVSPAAPEAPQASVTSQEGITPGPKSEPKGEQRAPASWRPDVREHWAQLPPDVRAEVARREGEMQRAMQETSEVRKFAEQLSRVVEPYQVFIKAENSNPLQAIDNLMSTAARLRTSTAPELAQLMAGMVRQFGVGRFGNQFIEALDSALAGEIPHVDPQQVRLQQAIQQQLAPVTQFMSQFQQAQYAHEARVRSKASSEVEQFLAQAEFGADVREEMADLMEVAERHHRSLSLQDAYRQACVSDPRIRKVLQGRLQAHGTQQLTGAAQRAKAAAVSVSGAPTLAPMQAEPDSVRAAVVAAIAANSR